MKKNNIERDKQKSQTKQNCKRKKKPQLYERRNAWILKTYFSSFFFFQINQKKKEGK